METASLVFPHQLFKRNPCLAHGRSIYLVEDPLYFRQYAFHKKKIILHRAAMKFYEDFLLQERHAVKYIPAHDEDSNTENLFNHFRDQSIAIVHYCDTTDYLLERRLHRFAARSGIQLVMHDSPCFLNNRNMLYSYFAGKTEFFQHDFYVRERKRLQLLTNGKQPLFGKWSFDKENRKKIPAKIKLPPVHFPSENKFVSAAIKYAANFFPANPGSGDNFFYATTFEEASAWLDDFLQYRMTAFGPYEDAMLRDESFLFHSCITHALNTGLLTPGEVLERVIKFSLEQPLLFASLEGFVRQLIGWREFVRGVYLVAGSTQRKRNFWNHHRSIPSSLCKGCTGIDPVDAVIKRLMKCAYTHHIERLMILGNFMLLCEFNPDEVYRWFMEMYIDAYDWVMVPNVYGMSQFSDGGLMSTKPYISGSNYILKMSNFPRGEWCNTWDALYWRFLHNHRDFFSGNPRTTVMANLLGKMRKAKLKNHLEKAEEFLAGMNRE